MSDSADADRQIGVQAVETAMTVLGSLLSSSESMRITDVAEAAGMPPAKAHRYLVSFIRLGYVEQERSGLYRLGPGSLRLGLHCLAQLDPQRVSRPFIDDLSFELNETVFSAAWTPDGPIVIDWRGPWRPLSVNIRIGTLLPLLYSAAGRVFLAFAQKSLIQVLLSREELGGPPAQSSRREALRPGQVAKLESQIRAQGYATVEGDYYQGVKSVSAPVFDHSGSLVIALTVVGMSSTFDAARWDHAVAAVRIVADKISAALGHTRTSTGS